MTNEATSAPPPAAQGAPVVRQIRLTIPAFDALKATQRDQRARHGVTLSNSEVITGILTGAIDVAQV